MASTGNDAMRTTKWYLDRIGYLSQFMLPERERILREVVDRRTRYMTVCTENTFDPHNASALVRHCDAFGVQDIYAIEELHTFTPNIHIVKGTAKWVTIRRNKSVQDTISALRGGGYRIIATTPHEGDATPECFDIGAGPFALIFGAEHDGISEQVADSADGFLRIPMHGFVESLNVSASAAIAIYILSQRLRSENIGWELTEAEKAELLFEWTMKTIRHSEHILAKYPGGGE